MPPVMGVDELDVLERELETLAESLEQEYEAREEELMIGAGAT